MNLEFHYYTTVFLSLKAGFSRPDALLLGQACQTVDTNVLGLKIRTDRGPLDIIPTQNYGYWDRDTPRDVYLPFHFLPGGPDQPTNRTDGKTNPFSVYPNNPLAKNLLVTALKTRNLYRVGIALHTFADSWAHQNFTGLNESWNALDARSLAPAVGHAQAGRSPDLWTEVWTDSRLKNKVVINFDRFAEAFRKIYRYLCIFNKQEFDREDFVFWEWKELLEANRYGKTPDDRMLGLRLEFDIPVFDRSDWLEEAVNVPDKGLQDETLFEGYDKVLWVMDQFLFKTKILRQDELPARPGFYTSPFWQWQTAAAEHRQAAHALLDQQLPGWRQRLPQG